MALTRRAGSATIEGRSNSELVAITRLNRRTYFKAKARLINQGLFRVERTTAPGRGMSRNRYHLVSGQALFPRPGVNYGHSGLYRTCHSVSNTEQLRSTASAGRSISSKVVGNARSPRDSRPPPDDVRLKDLVSELSRIFPGAPPPARMQWVTFSRLLPGSMYARVIARAEELASNCERFASVTAVFSRWLLEELGRRDDVVARMPERMLGRLRKPPRRSAPAGDAPRAPINRDRDPSAIAIGNTSSAAPRSGGLELAGAIVDRILQRPRP